MPFRILPSKACSFPVKPTCTGTCACIVPHPPVETLCLPCRPTCLGVCACVCVLFRLLPMRTCALLVGMSVHVCVFLHPPTGDRALPEGQRVPCRMLRGGERFVAPLGVSGPLCRSKILTGQTGAHPKVRPILCALASCSRNGASESHPKPTRKHLNGTRRTPESHPKPTREHPEDTRRSPKTRTETPETRPKVAGNKHENMGKDIGGSPKPYTLPKPHMRTPKGHPLGFRRG